MKTPLPILIAASAVAMIPSFVVDAFQIPARETSRALFRQSSLILSATDEQDVVSPTPDKESFDTRVMELFLKQKYPAFMNLLSNQDIWNELANGDGGYTIFAPNNKVFDDLGKDKLRQLVDPRNLETTEKIAMYHAIPSPVSSKEIYDSNTGGIKTLGGEVPVGKTKTGGFLGIGGKEDGGVTVNGAKIIESFEVTNCIVHEVDGLISLQLLWRYMDQLRIPGT